MDKSTTATGVVQAKRGREATQFKPGQSGNPGGKAIGTRNAINADFLRALVKDFEAAGPQTLVKARLDDPMGYIRMVASLLPKEFKVDAVNNDLSGLTPEEVDAVIGYVEQIRATARGRVEREKAAVAALETPRTGSEKLN